MWSDEEWKEGDGPLQLVGSLPSPVLKLANMDRSASRANRRERQEGTRASGVSGAKLMSFD